MKSIRVFTRLYVVGIHDCNVYISQDSTEKRLKLKHQITRVPTPILLVEDSPGDVGLMREALRAAGLPVSLSVVSNGEDAMSFLKKTGMHEFAVRPELVFLDLNLPGKCGLEVLAEMKKHSSLRRIPVIILTTSDAENDVFSAYQLHANCYVKKPDDFDQFIRVVKACEDFWLSVAQITPN
jgi:chemotaxis family two-component system response regulator Rcp1